MLANDARALDALVKETSIGETYFFREEDGYSFVQRRLAALAQKRSREGARPFVRLWSAGCASGEEAYSLAIVALETLGRAVDIAVVGTDLNAASLARAEAASYGPWSFRGVSAERKAAWFEPSGASDAQGDLVRPIEAVRRLVKFERLNLAQDHAPANHWRESFDLILCRNVLLYFSLRQLPAVARRLAGALAPSGRLVLGATDPSLTSAALSRTAQVPPVYRRADEVAQRRSAFPAALSAPVGDSVETDAEGARSSDPGRGAMRESRTPARPRKKLTPAPQSRAPASAPAPALFPPATRALSGSSPEGSPAQETAEPAVSGRRSAEAFAKARALADAGQYGAAAACLDGALQAMPLEAPLHLLRGMVALSAGDAAQALRRADAALLLDSSLGMAHLLAAMAAAKENDGERAGRSARNALASFVRSDDPPPCASESKDDLMQACRALLRQRMAPPVRPGARKERRS